MYSFISSACLSADCRELQAARLPAEIISSQMEAVSQACGTTRASLACAVVVSLVSHGEEQGYNEQSETRL